MSRSRDSDKFDFGEEFFDHPERRARVVRQCEVTDCPESVREPELMCDPHWQLVDRATRVAIHGCHAIVDSDDRGNGGRFVVDRLLLDKLVEQAVKQVDAAVRRKERRP